MPWSTGTTDVRSCAEYPIGTSGPSWSDGSLASGPTTAIDGTLVLSGSALPWLFSSTMERAGHGPRRRQVRGGELRVLHPVGIGQRVGEHAGQVFQGQYVAHVVVDGRHADLAAPHEGRPVVRVRGVLAGHLHAHLDVHARGQREPRGIRPACRVPEGFEFLDRLVVADDRAVESPLVAQDRREQVGVRAGRYAVERVERAHHRRRARVDRCLVGRQVDRCGAAARTCRPCCTHGLPRVRRRRRSASPWRPSCPAR